MLRRRDVYALIFGTITIVLSLPASAQSQTGTAALDGDELEPGRPRRSRDDYRQETGDQPARSTRSEQTDHAAVVGHWGVGWFGVSNIITSFDLDGSDPGGIVAAPVLGVRYWLSDMIGIDAGIGIAISGSGADVEAGGTNTETDGPSTFGLLLHGGLPIAFKSGQHYSFIVVPEINIGFASISRQTQIGPMMTQTVENSGFRLDLGGRAGAEVYFGFIDVPELALEASVGLYLTRVQAREEQGGVIQRVGQTSISTTSLNNPWDFFRTTVAARYYF